MKNGIDPNAERRAWMGLLARSPAAHIADLFAERPAFDWLRTPEVGSTMVRGRTGASGAPFNLGEVTVTRCALRLPCGTVGHAYVQGRDKAHSEAAALLDALMQTEAAPRIRATVLEPLERRALARRNMRAAKAAATKVDFFTMVRGED